LNRMKRKWTSLAIAISMLVTLLVPMSAYAAGPRIDITSPFAEASATDSSQPKNLNQVPRFTTNSITITAGIQNITDSQITEIYYEITNIKSNPANNVTTVVKSNPAQHVPGSFTIEFNNVTLTEGLNKITVMMGTGSLVSSAPSWAYFTPTTNITNLTVNGVPFVDTDSYPKNPGTNTIVTISGQAANATSVEVSVGNSAPKTVYLSNGTFFFTADNKTNSTSSFRVNAGDNPIIIVAKNSGKTYQIKKNLIYDDGKPFAFNALISTKSIATDTAIAASGELISAPYTLSKPNVALGTIELWPSPGKGGTRIAETEYTVKTNAAGISNIEFLSDPGTAYAYYSYNNTPLLTTPTTETTNVGISANLKVDLLPTKTLKYRFVDILAGGKRFGPYDLAKAGSATTATDNGLFPSVINDGYSDMIIGIQGTGLNNLGNALLVEIEDKTGAVVTATGGLTQYDINKTGTMAYFELDHTSTVNKDGSPYKVTISNGNSILNTYRLTVSNAGTIPAASNIDFSTPLKEGYPATDESVDITITPSATIVPTKLRIEVADGTGQIHRITANGTTVSGDTVTYKLPAGLLAGQYKLKVFYNEIELTQRLITILPPDPSPPVVTNPVSPLIVSIPNTTATASYFAVQGKNLGFLKDDIIDVDVVDSVYGGASTGATVTSEYVNGSTIIFKIEDVQSLTDGVTYDVTFNKREIDSDGNTNDIPYKVLNVIKAKALTGLAKYGDETVTNVFPGTGATPPPLLQIDKSDLATATLTIQGEQLLLESKVNLQFMNIATGALIGSGYTATTVSSSGDSATAKIPTALSPGTYLVRVGYNGHTLGQYPLTIGGAALSSLSPSLTYLGDSTTSLEVNGTGFGFDKDKLTLKLVSDSTGQVSTQAVTSLESENHATFDLPTLPAGNYTVSLLYNLVAGGAALNYTVAPAQPALQENAVLSIKDRYKVFNFSAGIQIPTDRDQFVQFKFYNFTTDILPPTTFSYHYVDSSLPYVQNAMIGDTQQLSELSLNTIGEMPTKLVVYSNELTERVNLYLGNYTSSSVPFASKDTDAVDNGLRKVEFDLTSLPNGATKFTIIPSTVSTSSGGAAALGENFSGKKVYDITVTSIPYMIVNNIYNGMVVKNPDSEIMCNTEGTPLDGGCISGRFVNIPLENWVVPAPGIPDANVEMYVNGIKTDIVLDPLKINIDKLDPDYGSFKIAIPPNPTTSTILEEGKNTISFSIYLKGVLQTKSSFDIFVFSTTAPEFQIVKPIETSDIPKFISGTLKDTYATSETAVSFSGQFVNATDLKLTVKQKDADGNQVSVYDRRFSNAEGTTLTMDPETNNPGYLKDVNFANPPLSFTTDSINLATKGDTVFEFTITNSSNVTLTRSITITREPLPYVLIYPVLTKNSSGKEQANINSNYVEIEMAAEGADSVNFGGKTDAVKRAAKDINGNDQTHFFYEARDLKAGANNIKFTVVRGTQKTNGTFILFNSNTTVEGAQYKSVLKPSLKVFSNELELKFPAGTNLMRNEPAAVNQYLTADRKILFGIASNVDGRVDKYKNPSNDDQQIDNPYTPISDSGKLLLSAPNERFRPASKLYWIDAGTIPATVTDQVDALSGGGKLPYDPVDFFSRDIKDLVVPTKRGTLTLKYDANIRSDAWKYITVYHYDIYEDFTGTVQFRWHNIGGVVDATKNTVTVPFETFGYYQVMYMNQSFDDITSHPWARNQLDTLYSKGIMVNEQDTEFVPNANISRGEFSALLVKIFDIPLQYTETPTFADVLRFNPQTNGIYDYRYIETAASAGIVRGSGGGRFSPDESVTRQDAAVMISRAANLKLNTSTDKSLTTLQKAFTDANSIDLYARTAVEAVNKAALIEGKLNILIQGQKKATYRFDPDQTFTRAEAAEVAIRVLRQQKKIPK
jgi:hypothetical protein